MRISISSPPKRERILQYVWYRNHCQQNVKGVGVQGGAEQTRVFVVLRYAGRWCLNGCLWSLAAARNILCLDVSAQVVKHALDNEIKSEADVAFHLCCGQRVDQMLERDEACMTLCLPCPTSNGKFASLEAHHTYERWLRSGQPQTSKHILLFVTPGATHLSKPLYIKKPAALLNVQH